MSETPESAASHPTRLTGAEIVWATLEGEGVREVPDPPYSRTPRAGRGPHG
jgi:hypothetical protein